MKLRCYLEKHEREGCKCKLCGAPMHDLYVVSETIEDAGGCCWDSSMPCEGPYCGVPCENWTTGKSGTVVTVRKCRRCGETFTDEELKEYRDYRLWQY